MNKDQGIPINFATVIQEMYNICLKATIKTDVKGKYFEIKKGVGQGDPLSSVILNGTLEQTFRKLNRKGNKYKRGKYY